MTVGICRSCREHYCFDCDSDADDPSRYCSRKCELKEQHEAMYG